MADVIKYRCPYSGTVTASSHLRLEDGLPPDWVQRTGSVMGRTRTTAAHQSATIPAHPLLWVPLELVESMPLPAPAPPSPVAIPQPDPAGKAAFAAALKGGSSLEDALDAYTAAVTP